MRGALRRRGSFLRAFRQRRFRRANQQHPNQQRVSNRRIFERRSQRDAGFMLLEVIVGFVIVTIVMAALTGLFVHTIQSTSHQRASQTAVRLVTQQADEIRGVAADAVAARIATPQTVTVAGAQYTITTQANPCFEPVTRTGSGAGSSTCGELSAVPAGSAYASSRRITITVQWSGTSCTGGTCSYSDSIVVNDDRDPTFAFNTDPPPPPVLTGCLDQTVTVDQVIDLDLRGPQIGCVVTDGIAPFTWAISALPAGLTLTPDGRITGTVAGPPATINSKATATDAFLRTTTDEFGWRVVNPLTDFHVRNLWLRIGHDTQVSVNLANFLNEGATGITYQLVSGQLPAGLTLDEATGVISGKHKEKAPHDYPITLKASDAAGHSVQSSFMYYVRGNWPNRLLLCPTTKLPYDPPIAVTTDPPPCHIPGYYDEANSRGSDVVEFRVNQPIPTFNLWDDVYGGTSPYRFVKDATAPAWVQVDPNTGVVSGTPTQVTKGQPLKFLIQVYDSQDFFYDKITVRWRVIE